MRCLLPVLLLGCALWASRFSANFRSGPEALLAESRGVRLSPNLFQERLRIQALLQQERGTLSLPILQQLQQELVLLGVLESFRPELLKHLRTPGKEDDFLEQLQESLSLQWDLSTAELALDIAQKQKNLEQAAVLRCQIWLQTGQLCDGLRNFARRGLEQGQCKLEAGRVSESIPELLLATKDPVTASQAYWLLGKSLWEEDPSGSRYLLRKALFFRHLQASLFLDGANPRGRYFDPPISIDGFQLHSVILSPVPLDRRVSRKAQTQFSVQPAFLPGETVQLQLLWSLDSIQPQTPSFSILVEDGFSRAVFPLSKEKIPRYLGATWNTSTSIKAFDWLPAQNSLALSLCLESTCKKTIPLLSEAPGDWFSGLPIHAAFHLENRDPEQAAQLLQRWFALTEARNHPLPPFLQAHPRLPKSLHWLSEARRRQGNAQPVAASQAAWQAFLSALLDGGLSLQGLGEVFGLLAQKHPERDQWLAQLAVLLDPASREAQRALSQSGAKPLRPYQLFFPPTSWKGSRGRNLWSNGLAGLAFDFLAGPCQVALSLSGSTVQGTGALARITWNGSLLQKIEVPSPTFRPLQWNLDCQGRRNLLEVEFLNDLWVAGEDRNLVLGAVKVQSLGSAALVGGSE